MKKGDIWISAALYFGLGVVVITIILTAGMPVIDKLRDKNTYIQTKDLLYKLDNNIREVVRGGAGEQRYVELEIKKGDFIIYNKDDTINWSMESKIQISEVGIPIEEGGVYILTKSSNVVGEYNIMLSLDYSNIADISSGEKQTIKGVNQLIIKHNGVTSAERINVTITSL